jgi:hypothetical protein
MEKQVALVRLRSSFVLELLWGRGSRIELESAFNSELVYCLIQCHKSWRFSNMQVVVLFLLHE